MGSENAQRVPHVALWMTTLAIQGFLLVTWFAEQAFTLALKMTSAMTLLPYLLVAAYGFKLAWTGETYAGEAGARSKGRMIGALATLYAAAMLLAGGAKFLLLSALLYAPGTCSMPRRGASRVWPCSARASGCCSGCCARPRWLRWLRCSPARSASDLRKDSAMKTRLLAVSIAALLAGCTVGPNYVRPTVDTPPGWRIDYPKAADVANLKWWEQFGDPVLNNLVETALRDNRDLRVAAARVDQFIGALTTTGSQLYPQIGYGADASPRACQRRGLSAAAADTEPVLLAVQRVAGREPGRPTCSAACAARPRPRRPRSMPASRASAAWC